MMRFCITTIILINCIGALAMYEISYAPQQFLIQADGTIVYVDLEDPDNSNPDYFFNADYEKVKSNIRWGLSDFHKMCTKLLGAY